MILTKLVINEIGPFSPQATVNFDREVTVLTGPNDTGKSSVLQIIDIICNSRQLEERYVNLDRISAADRPWTHDPDIFCLATFVMTEHSRRWLAQVEAPAGAEVDVKFTLAPQVGRPRTIVTDVRVGDSLTRVNGGSATRFPKILRLPVEDEIRAVISVNDLNPVEAKLCQLAFGPNGAAKLSGLSEPVFRTQLRRGVARLNDKLANIQGASGRFELVLDRVDSNPLSFAVALRDIHGGDTPPYLRGSGIRKLVTLLVLLLEIDYQSDHVYILFDEPENSLHADMQHFLRSLLEDLAKNENLQVIYATHSPAMINPLKVDALRLFERSNVEDRAVSVVHNRPFERNFVRVRSSLGVSPADLLLYAPITIIVEGATEILGIPYLLLRLHGENVPGFERVPELLASSHFLDGEGDSFEYMCRLAKSQGCKPIIFVDGDKIRRIKQQRVEEQHRDVPIILLPDGQEFEDLVPRVSYFQALAEVSEQDTQHDVFEQWNATCGLPERVVFTKRVDRWLQDNFDGLSVDKPRTMKRALEISELEQISLESLRQLVNAMSNLLLGQ